MLSNSTKTRKRQLFLSGSRPGDPGPESDEIQPDRGQQQRAGIARALANHPRLLLADEPTRELDSNTARDILKLFQEIVETEHLTLLMSSHDPLGDKYVDEIVQLKDGRIVSSA